jgi:uncharacterized protein (DUF1800 family)
MTILCRSHRGTARPSLAVAIICLFSAVANPADAQTESQINRAVWKQIYGVLDSQINDPSWMSGDADGDGVPNSAELAAGTNPFPKGSGEAHFRPPHVLANPDTLLLEFPTVEGKYYQAETGDLSGTWNAGALPGVAGDGKRRSLIVPKNAGNFFRIRVSDRVTLNDGMSDWAKKILGFSSTVPLADQTSHSPASLANTLASENTVSISSPAPIALQPGEAGTAGDAGVIRIARTGSILPGEITVPLTTSGTAIEGTDFTALPDSVTFPAGVKSIDLRVVPLFNPSRKSNTTVTLTAGPPGSGNADGGYTIGAPNSAGVTIRPTHPADGTGLAATYFPGASSSHTNAANFNGLNGGLAATYSYTRGSPTTTGTIVVTYSGMPTEPFIIGAVRSLRFTSGNLTPRFTAAANYSLTAISANTFTVRITDATALPSSGSGNLVIENFASPVTRIDPQIDFSFSYGTPNGNIYILPDHYSVRWEGWLSPGTAGDFTFQLEADDKARVLVDLNDGQGLRQILENGWDTPATNAFKLSAPLTMGIPAAPADRYRMIVEFVETTGNARCRIQCKRGTGAFGNFPAAANISNVYTNNSTTTAGFSASYYQNTAFSGNPARSQTDSSITNGNNGDWGAGTPDPSIFHNNFSVRWSGQILPQYTGKYYFVTKADDGSKLWINDQLVVDRWNSTAELTGTIDLQAGVFYNIVMEAWENTGHSEARLWWYSDDQPKQIVPTNRLFPLPGTTPKDDAPQIAGPVLTSPANVSVVFDPNAPFSIPLTSSNSGVISIDGLPDWLSLDDGVLTGTPPGPGVYQFNITTRNEAGNSSTILTIEILGGQSSLTRELWTNIATGAKLSDVPWHLPPTTTDTLSAVEDTDDDLGANTGERIRGYFIAPSSGNYYFWIASSNAAELWISNDGEPVNKVLRASVSAPGTASREWTAQPSQKSPWLSLVSGRKYYIEILHNTGPSPATNHVSAGWFQDPTGNTASPIANGSGLIPSHLLLPWDDPPTITVPGTLYVTHLAGVDGLSGITATGGAFIRLSGNSAVIQIDHNGLSSGVTSRTIRSSSGQLLFDVTARERNYPTTKTTDGGIRWEGISAEEMAALSSGNARIVVATVAHPEGEIAGIFGRVEGSQAPPAPPAYPSWPDNHATDDAANSRFLTQATFGPHPVDMAKVKTDGYRKWIDDQFAIPPTRTVPDVLANLSGDPQNPYGRDLFFNSWWKNSVTAPDQLRQRAAFALSEIFVVSNTGPLDNNGRVLADYYDSLLDSAFGNFRDILKHVTLSPAMGVYLDMRGNSAGNIMNGVHPNENYAREILQLFSAGLYRRWPDGTLVLDSKGLAVPTYDQSVITGFARVFTGWNWGQPLAAESRLPTSFSPSTNYLDPMVLVPAKHELGTKILLDNVVLPAATVTSSTDTSTDPGSTYQVQSTDPALGAGNLVTTTITNRYDLNGLRDIEASFDNIMNNPAVAPYICRQLIQRLVTSHPKPEYVARVVRAYNGERNVDGIATGIDGDMKEVFRAILLDYEARSSTAAADPRFGKQREPVLRMTGPARSLAAPSFPGSTYRQAGYQQMLITTPQPHELGTETVHLSQFVDSGAAGFDNLPDSQGYTVAPSPSYSFVKNVGTGVDTGVVTVNAGGYLTGDVVALQFTSGSLNKAPFNTVRDYTVTSSTPTTFTLNPGSTGLSGDTSGNTLTPYNFTVNTTGLVTAAYTVSGSSATFTSSGIVQGHELYLKFATGGLAGAGFDRKYTVASATSTTFTVNLGAVPANPAAGSALIPRFAAGYNVTNDTTGGGSFIDFSTGASHNLKAGDNVFINILITNNGPAPLPDGVYTVSSIRSRNVFRVVSPTRYTAGSQSSGGMLAYPVKDPTWTRSGTCTVRLGTFSVGGTGGDLGQTPLNSPTVFNYFYPDYQYPGPMAQAGMTTPEFQLTDDSSIMNLTNGLTGGILSGTTNGYTNYKSSSIVCDLGPYMTPALTSNAGIKDLIDSLGTLLTGGNLTSGAKDIIAGYVGNNSNFGYTTPTPTVTQMRDRVRAVVHLILVSPQYAIQR